MIQPLRRRHRFMVTTLGVLILAGFLIGLQARQDVPHMAAAELGSAGAVRQALGVPGERLGDLPLLARTLRLPVDERGVPVVDAVAPDAASGYFLQLLADPDWNEADVLVYLTQVAGPHDALPPAAQLLGPMGGWRGGLLPIPDATPWLSSSVVLYSLAHQKVLGSGPLPQVEP